MNRFFASVSAAAMLTAISTPALPENTTIIHEDHDALTCLTEQSNLFLNPFNKNSAAHRPIGEDAKFAGTDAASTQSVQISGFGQICSDNGWGANVYEAGANDPERTVGFANLDGADRGGAGKGLPVTIRIPDSANNGENHDSAVVIVDREAGVAHEFYQWRWNNGSPTAKHRHEVDIKGLGHADDDQKRVGTTAAGMSILHGLLRASELNTPGCKIQHALQLTLSHGKKNCGKQLSGEIVWPASGTDWFCESQPEMCSGGIPYGGLLAIPRDIDIDSLDLSEPGKRVAEALKNYGAYAVDGSACPNFRADQGVNDEIRKQLKVDMQKLWTRMRLVTNNEKEEETAGGGAPCAENTAFDSPEPSKLAECGKSPDDSDNPPPDDGDNPPPDDGDNPPPDDGDNPPPDDGRNPPPDDGDNPPPDDGDNPPPDEQTWQEQLSQWLWEHLPRTTEGLKLFRDFFTDWF